MSAQIVAGTDRLDAYFGEIGREANLPTYALSRLGARRLGLTKLLGCVATMIFTPFGETP